MKVDASASGGTIPRAAGGITGGAGVILVVEGAPVDRTVLCRVLERAPLLGTGGNAPLSNHAVLAVSTGKAALNCVLLNLRPVVCILLGRSLPDMNRVDFLDTLRAEPGSVAARVPVVVLTPPGNSNAAMEALKAGAQEYLPWDDRTAISDPDALARAVRTALTGAQLSREVREGEARFRETFEQAPVGIGHVDPETGAWLRVNRQLAKIADATPEEMAAFFPFAPLFGFEAVDVAGAGPREVRLPTVAGESDRWASVTVSRPDGADYLIAAVEDVTARRSAERDRHIAQTLQASLLPVVTAAASPELEVVATCVPAMEEAEVGGDFYDVFPLANGLTALAVGDVMGKGLEAALSIAEVRFALRGFLRENPDPSLALRRLNRFLLEAQRLEGRPQNALVALSLAVLGGGTGHGWVAAAGAEAPIIVHTDFAQPAKIECLADVGDIVLGVDPGATYAPQAIHLSKDDILVLTTDGLAEARPPGSDVLFAAEGGLWPALRDAFSSLADLDTAAQSIIARGRAFANGSLRDDVCLLMARRFL